MNKKSHVKFAALLFVCCVMLGCGKDKNQGSIFGIVTDKSSGDCVANAGVELLPKGLKTITGVDGTFEFTLLDPGDYNLYVTKTGYKDSKSNTITVTSGEQIKGDVQIEKLPASLQILDNDGNVITELDYGGDVGVVSKTFKLYNRGDAPFRIKIYKDVNWIESITPNEGTVPVNGNFPVILKINRENLANGINTTSIIVSSETVGGVELTVKATKGSVPTVITTAATNITSTSALCGGSVTSNGNMPVNQTGVCYSTSQNPTVSDQYAVGNGNTGTFTCSVTGLSPSTKYYFRAFATNGAGTGYGEQKEFTTPNIYATFEYAGVTYFVHPDAGKMTRGSAVDYCDGLTFAGYSDWFLPNQDELNAMYVYRNSIGGFVTSGEDCMYWSSTEIISGGYCYRMYQDFSTGEQHGSIWATPYYRVRPIRKDVGSGGGTISTYPTVTTNEVTNVTSNSATCCGNVSSDGGTNVIQRGVCYSTLQNPTTSNQIITSGTGNGSYTCNITGLSANTTYFVRAYAINSVGTAYGGQKSFTTNNSSGGGGQTYFYDFDSGAQNWQTIDADGDGLGWSHSSNPGTYHNSGVNLSGTGHNASEAYMISGSYANQTQTPLTPNNYLVSPQKYTMSNGAKISFYVCAQDANYAAEHYGVAISTASNPTANSFVTIWEETLSAKVRSGDIVRGNRTQGNWYLKTINLSAYAGQTIWVAIRHFNCPDQFVINVDDITIVTGN